MANLYAPCGVKVYQANCMILTRVAFVFKKIKTGQMSIVWVAIQIKTV